jgi:hypothetical protein
MSNQTLLSVEINSSGVQAVRVMAYSDEIEEEADRVYQRIKKHLCEIDKALSQMNPKISDVEGS